MSAFTSVQATPLSQFLIDPATPIPPTTYKTVGTTPETLTIFKPDGWKASDSRPAVILIHGGAWVGGDDKVFYPHARYFASRGAVALSINYRLVTATGPSLGDCLTDCKSAVRWVRGHAADLGIDPNKVAVMGDSAGGHLAGALGTCSGFDDPQDDLKVSAVPNVVIMCNPITDMMEGTWAKFVLRGDWLKKKNLTAADLVLTPEETALAKSLSPLDCIQPGQPPVLLMHGTEDHIVNPKQAQDFADAYNKAGNHCELVWMQGMGHAFALVKYHAPETVVVEAITRADAFMGQHGFWTTPPALEVSSPPAWVPKPTNKPNPSPTPAAH